MFRTGGVRGDVGQVDVGRSHAGQFDLGFFSGFTQTLHGHFVDFEVDALVLLELIHEIIDDALVKVVAAEAVVAVGGQDLEDAVTDFED